MATNLETRKRQSSSQESQDSESEIVEKKRRYMEREMLFKANRVRDYEFVRLFTMSRSTFNDFVNEVAPYFPRGNSKNNRSFQIHERLLYFLKFASSNERYIDQRVCRMLERCQIKYLK